jgi:uncharacterized protein (TIGR03067 family)
MMSRPLLLSSMLCFCFVSDAWGVTRKDDLAGEWRIVSAKLGNGNVPSLKNARLSFSDGRKVTQMAEGESETGYYTFDSSRRPKEIETTTDGEPGIQKGIYSVVGRRLTLCLSRSGRVRPKRFNTRDNDDLLLLTLERVPASRNPARSGKPTGPTRAFRMGFSGTLHDLTQGAVVVMRRFCRDNGDLIAHKIDGVPWAEELAGGPYRADFLQEWQGKKEATPTNGKVFVSLSPGKGTLKKADKSGPIPPALQGKPYNDPLVKKAYLAYCRRAVKFFQPDYLCIGSDANEIYMAGRDKWQAYTELHRYVYAQLKREHTRLPIFASFALHAMFNKRGVMQSEFQRLMPFNDIVAVSYFPFMVPAARRPSVYGWLTSVFDRYRKPYAMVQTGALAETVRLPQSGQEFPGSSATQSAHFESLLALAHKRKFAFVVNFVGHDMDQLWDRLKDVLPEVFMIFRDCGMIDENGFERPAFAVWKRYFAMPLREVKSR